MFTVLIKSNLPEFTAHDLYHYVFSAAAPSSGANLKAYLSTQLLSDSKNLFIRNVGERNP